MNLNCIYLMLSNVDFFFMCSLFIFYEFLREMCIQLLYPLLIQIVWVFTSFFHFFSFFLFVSLQFFPPELFRHVNSRCENCWCFLHSCYKMISPVGLIIHPSLHMITVSFLWWEDFRFALLTTFKYKELLTVITVLIIRFLGLVSLVNGSLYSLTNISPFSPQHTLW